MTSAAGDPLQGTGSGASGATDRRGQDELEMQTTGAASSGHRPWQRALVVVLALVAVVHAAVLALWVSPSGPVRDAVGDRALAAWVNPYFAQQWSALVPNAQFADESFMVRAQVRDGAGGAITMSDWMDVTAVETDALRHDIDPARVHVAARRIATNLNAAMFGLNPRQRELVAASYTKEPIERLGDRLYSAGTDRQAAVRSYVTYDTMATRFASMYARARLDGTILKVQYRVGRRTVPAGADRPADTLQDRDFRWFAFGFRRGFTASYEAQTAFERHAGA
ncbi:hypothetical protein GEV27_17440 [Aeromicrobium sp. S22]|uniref:DUF5819 family protein n=1 Tax=Aeromicrobium sp. S22 TaxID=2662029 RepID=UPI00129D6010|nr:DUF5819 family protein [Aeromicrobium sp. S22]MRK03299.1 hypothetical protein [Aeromicrobium sp. S22]